jgi:hypothetical protein
VRAHELAPLVDIKTACRVANLGHSRFYELVKQGAFVLIPNGSRRNVTAQNLHQYYLALIAASTTPQQLGGSNSFQCDLMVSKSTVPKIEKHGSKGRSAPGSLRLGSQRVQRRISRMKRLDFGRRSGGRISTDELRFGPRSTLDRSGAEIRQDVRSAVLRRRKTRMTKESGSQESKLIASSYG